MLDSTPREDWGPPIDPLSQSGSTGDTFLARLPAEVDGWQNQGIITPEQGRAIIACYQGPGLAAAVAVRRGRLVTILATLGSLLLGLGVILFFAANWEEIPRGAKLSLILAAIAAAYSTGYWLRYVRGYRRVGTAVVFLACLFYGAGIHLVAQVYHVELNEPNLFLYWFLGVLPMAYLTRSEVVLALGVLLFLAAMGFRLPGWMESADSGQPAAIFGLYLALGLMLYGLGKLQAQSGLTRSYARVYEAVGLTTTFFALYLLTFRGWYESHGYERSGTGGDIAAEFRLVLALATALAVSLAAAGPAFRLARRLPLLESLYEGAGALVVLLAAHLAVFIPAGDDFTYPIVFNLLLLMGILGLVLAGYSRSREALINAGLGFFGLDVVTRYFELSWTLMDRSVVFIIAGVLLLVGGLVIERGRRQVLGLMRPPGDVP